MLNNTTKSAPKGRTISPSETQKLLASNELFACIDVRERGEFASAQIAGTSPVNRGTLEYRVPVMIPNQEIPIVVCCDDGRRSALAASSLARMGYVHIQVLSGGTNGWHSAGLPLRSGWGVHGKIYGEQVAHEQHVPHITADDLAARFNNDKKLLVVDVRTQEEYLRGHVPNTYHIPGGNLLVDAPRLPIDEGTTLVISCAGRTRGILGAQILRESSFDNVFALENGAMGWRLAGHELAKGPGKELPKQADSDYAARIAKATRDLATHHDIRRGPVRAFKHVYDSDRPYYLVDVRLPEEFNTSHVPGAIPLPLGQIALTHENFMAARRAPVFAISNDELRPIWAAALLQDLGFTDVTVLEGGMQDWSTQGYPLENGPATPFVFGLDSATQNVESIDGEQLAKLEQHILLDVRSIGEYGFAHIPASRWLPRGRLELDIQEMIPDKKASIVTVCDNGTRSILAAETLTTLGYQSVKVLKGGTQAWQTERRTLEDGIEGTGIPAEQAQADFGHTVWDGALGKSREDMERYLSWEIELVKE